MITSLLPLLLLAAVQDTVIAAPRAGDTLTYATPALRTIVTDAAQLNRRVPTGLGRYRARVESEISFGNQRAEGNEFAASIEQVASELTWDRTGEFDQRVVGYRSQQVGFSLSTLGFFETGWLVPSLYGNRLSLLFGGADSTTRRAAQREQRRARRVVQAVHPLSVDREKVYRYRGGDTVQLLKVGDRTIRIIRVEVEPQPEVAATTVVFLGEVDLDADRRHIVRMRGRIARVGPRPAGERRPLLGRALQLEGIAYLELVNAEVEQRYWLPSYQRFEAQAMSMATGDARAVFRIVSRFRRVDVDSTSAVAQGSPADSLRVLPYRLTVASRDTLDAFTGWTGSLGALTSAVTANDFLDVAPPRLRPGGPPVTRGGVERFPDFFRVNRVEGVFLGYGVSTRMRDAFPGLTLRAHAGVGVAEPSVRGRVSADLVRGGWFYGARAGRSLDITNDFRTNFDSVAWLGDFVDRPFALLQVGRRLQTTMPSVLRLDVGWSRDRYVRNAWERGVTGRQEWRQNRGVDEGVYLRSALTLDWRPDIDATFVRTGVGTRVVYERGDGQLDFQRLEARVMGRRNWRRVILAGRVDGGVLWSDRPPPQQLFELGSTQGLPGYGYKEFAGDRAAMVRTLAMLPLGVAETPVRLFRQFWLPAPAPALSAQLQAGWTEASSAAARSSIERLGYRGEPDIQTLALFAPVPLSRPTDGWRATASVGLRFFGGALALLAAKPLDDGRGWRFVVSWGNQI